MQHASELALASVAMNTRRAYRADIRDWTRYAESIGATVAPAEPSAIAAYIASMNKRQLSRATIRRRCSAISYLHREKDLPSPMHDKQLQKVLDGVGRVRNEKEDRKFPLTPEVLVPALLNPKTKPRDRALFLFGMMTGLRRSEIVAIKWSDLEKHKEGIILHVGKTKTDQQGKGRDLFFPRHDNEVICPVLALDRWKKVCPHKTLVFPFSTQTIADRVKWAVRQAGEDPDKYSGHSIRAGLATTATAENIPQAEWMLQTGHVSYDQASKYARITDAAKNRTPYAVLAALDREVKKAQKP